MTTTFKIGLNKGKKRIWIDGRKLADAGFVGGTQYRCDAFPGGIYLSLDLDAPGRLRKVTGRPDGKPIIDMLGHDVSIAFPTEERVEARFSHGLIDIRAAEHDRSAVCSTERRVQPSRECRSVAL